MANFQQVPIVDVQSDNYKDMRPTILLALKTATFVAIDTELSGLGDRGRLKARSIDERYKAICEAAQTRSILSFGMSCFRLMPQAEPLQETDLHLNSGNKVESDSSAKQPRTLRFTVQTFNIMLLCSEDYVVEPASLKFLVDHGFDFNKQYATGIPYHRGSDQASEADQWMRQLFNELVVHQVPVVFHNALVDLVFLYQSFYATLPLALSSFLADLAEIFERGVFDTKYIVEFHARMPASYLEYVFRKCLRDNETNARESSSHISASFLTYPTSLKCVKYLQYSGQNKARNNSQNICSSYAAHGWCKAGSGCPNSHDVDLILDGESARSVKKRRKKHRKKYDSNTDPEKMCDSPPEAPMQSDLNEEMKDLDFTAMDCETSSRTDSKSQAQKTEAEPCKDTDHKGLSEMSVSSRAEGHRAGFDAFMTGYIFACFLSKFNKCPDSSRGIEPSNLGMGEFQNKVALGGKDIPLCITKSNFSKTSKEHKLKIEGLRELQTSS